jgi:hypothetical protein
MKDEGQTNLVARTTEFVIRVVNIFVALPKLVEARVLGSQVLRSGTSVCAGEAAATFCVKKLAYNPILNPIKRKK